MRVAYHVEPSLVPYVRNVLDRSYYDNVIWDNELAPDGMVEIRADDIDKEKFELIVERAKMEKLSEEDKNIYVHANYPRFYVSRKEKAYPKLYAALIEYQKRNFPNALVLMYGEVEE